MLLVIIILVIIIVFIYIKNQDNHYWKKKNIPSIKPLPLVGNYLDMLLLKSSMPEIEDKLCNKFPEKPLVGSYLGTKPCLIVADPEYIKIITTKDFYFFSNREVSKYAQVEQLNKNLFLSNGDDWKILRQNLTPLFSSAKLKKMFHLIEHCSKVYESFLGSAIGNQKVLNVRNLMSRFTMDCICSCAFGLNSRTMEDMGDDNPFIDIGNEVFNVPYNRFLKAQIRSVWPNIFYLFRLTINPEKVSNFFMKLLKEVFKTRQTVSTRNDFIDLFLGFKECQYMIGDSIKNFKSHERLKVKLNVDNDLLAAQCFILFIAGYETSSTTSSFALFELAKHQEIQARVRVEVDEYLQKHNNILNNESFNELTYLGQCVDETLRMYPVLGVITREVLETYSFSKPKLILEKGMRVHIPIYHVQRNAKYFPNPNEFKPERFSAEEKDKIVPYSYLPFGEGPRICIGMRFAKMQILAGLITVLKYYHVDLAEGTPTTIEFEPKGIVTSPKQNINLKFTLRDDCKPPKFA